MVQSIPRSAPLRIRDDFSLRHQQTGAYMAHERQQSLWFFMPCQSSRSSPELWHSLYPHKASFQLCGLFLASLAQRSLQPWAWVSSFLLPFMTMHRLHGGCSWPNNSFKQRRAKRTRLNANVCAGHGTKLEE